MSAIPPINSAINQTQVVKEFSGVSPLTINTLMQLPLHNHGIDNRGLPIIPGNTKLSELEARRKDINRYFTNLYSTNTSLRDKLNVDATESLNELIKKMAIYSPASLSQQQLTYIYSLPEFKNIFALTLICEEPMAALSLITANGCGLKSSDEDVKKGALNLLTAIVKFAGFSISGVNHKNKHLSSNFAIISLARKITHQLMDQNAANKAYDTYNRLDKEYEEIESRELNRIANLIQNDRQESLKKAS